MATVSACPTDCDAHPPRGRRRTCSEAIDLRPASKGELFPLVFHALLAELLARISFAPFAFACHVFPLRPPPPLGDEYTYRRPPSEGKRLLLNFPTPFLTLSSGPSRPRRRSLSSPQRFSGPPRPSPPPPFSSPPPSTSRNLSVPTSCERFDFPPFRIGVGWRPPPATAGRVLSR